MRKRGPDRDQICLGSVHPPPTRPFALVEHGHLLIHRLRFSDEPTPTRPSQPLGIAGVEVWLALPPADEGSPPRNTDPRDGQSGCRFPTQSSCCNLKAEFNSQDKGKTAYYALHRVSTRSGKGAVERGGDGSGVMWRTSRTE